MSDVTIVTEDAKRIVREGGVVNRPDRPLYFLSRKHGKASGAAYRFTAEVRVPVLNGSTGQMEDVRAGFVTVVDVHHADGCRRRPEPHGLSLGWYCHRDAKPDMWHWIVEPSGHDNDGPEAA